MYKLNMDIETGGWKRTYVLFSSPKSILLFSVRIMQLFQVCFTKVAKLHKPVVNFSPPLK